MILKNEQINKLLQKKVTHFSLPTENFETLLNDLKFNHLLGSHLEVRTYKQVLKFGEPQISSDIATTNINAGKQRGKNAYSNLQSQHKATPISWHKTFDSNQDKQTNQKSFIFAFFFKTNSRQQSPQPQGHNKCNLKSFMFDIYFFLEKYRKIYYFLSIFFFNNTTMLFST